MTDWAKYFDQELEKLKRQKNIYQQQLSTKDYKFDTTPAYPAKKPSATQPTVTREQSSKRSGLLNTLKNIGGKFETAFESKMNQIQTDASELAGDWKNHDYGEFAKDLIGDSMSYVPGPSGKFTRGMIKGKDNTDHSLGAKAGANFTAGVGDLVKGVGDTTRWITHDKAGKGLSNFAEKTLIQPYEQNYSKEFGWHSLLDPEFYATSGARALPFTLSLLVPGMAGAKIGATAGEIAANAAKLGTFGRTVAKTLMGGLGAHVATGPLEAAFEAANVYDQAKTEGHDDTTAHQMANKTFVQNEALLALSETPEYAMMFAPLIKGMGPEGAIVADTILKQIGKTGGKILGSAALEGGQEATQEWISANAQGKKVDPKAMQESGALGAIMGAGMTTLTHVSESKSKGPSEPVEVLEQIRNTIGEGDPETIIRSNIRNRMSDELSNEVNDLHDELQQRGFSPDEIDRHLDNFIATTDEGHGLIVEETERLAERLQNPQAPKTEEEANQQAKKQSQEKTTQEQTQEAPVNEQLRQDLADAMEQVITNTMPQTQEQPKAPAPTKTLEERKQEHMQKLQEKQEIPQGQTVKHSSTGHVGTYIGDPNPKNPNLVSVQFGGEVKYWNKQNIEKTDEQPTSDFDQEPVYDDGVEPDSEPETEQELTQDEEAKLQNEKEIANTNRKDETFPIGSTVTVKGLSDQFVVEKNHDNSMLSLKNPKTGAALTVGRAAATFVEGPKTETPVTEHSDKQENLAEKVLSRIDHKFANDYQGSEPGYTGKEFKKGDAVYSASIGGGVTESKIANIDDKQYTVHPNGNPKNKFFVPFGVPMQDRSLFHTKEEAEQVAKAWGKREEQRRIDFISGKKPEIPQEQKGFKVGDTVIVANTYEPWEATILGFERGKVRIQNAKGGQMMVQFDELTKEKKEEKAKDEKPKTELDALQEMGNLEIIHVTEPKTKTKEGKSETPASTDKTDEVTVTSKYEIADLSQAAELAKKEKKFILFANLQKPAIQQQAIDFAKANPDFYAAPIYRGRAKMVAIRFYPPEMWAGKATWKQERNWKLQANPGQARIVIQKGETELVLDVHRSGKADKDFTDDEIFADDSLVDFQKKGNAWRWIGNRKNTFDTIATPTLEGLPIGEVFGQDLEMAPWGIKLGELRKWFEGKDYERPKPVQKKYEELPKNFEPTHVLPDGRKVMVTDIQMHGEVLKWQAEDGEVQKVATDLFDGRPINPLIEDENSKTRNEILSQFKRNDYATIELEGKTQLMRVLNEKFTMNVQLLPIDETGRAAGKQMVLKLDDPAILTMKKAERPEQKAKEPKDKNTEWLKSLVTGDIVWNTVKKTTGEVRNEWHPSDEEIKVWSSVGYVNKVEYWKVTDLAPYKDQDEVKKEGPGKLAEGDRVKVLGTGKSQPLTGTFLEYTENQHGVPLGKIAYDNDNHVGNIQLHDLEKIEETEPKQQETPKAETPGAYSVLGREVTVTESKDTRDNKTPIWVVRLTSAEKIANWNQVTAQMKKWGGRYYGSRVAGLIRNSWVFKSDPTEHFVTEKKEETPAPKKSERPDQLVLRNGQSVKIGDSVTWQEKGIGKVTGEVENLIPISDGYVLPYVGVKWQKAEHIIMHTEIPANRADLKLAEAPAEKNNDTTKEETAPKENTLNKKDSFGLPDWNEYKNKHNMGSIFQNPIDLKANDVWDLVENWSDANFTGYDEKLRKAYYNYAVKVFKLIDKEFQKREFTDDEWKMKAKDLLDSLQSKKETKMKTYQEVVKAVSDNETLVNQIKTYAEMNAKESQEFVYSIFRKDIKRIVADQLLKSMKEPGFSSSVWNDLQTPDGYHDVFNELWKKAEPNREIKAPKEENQPKKTKDEMLNTLRDFFNEADGGNQEQEPPVNVQAPTKYDKARQKLSRFDRLAANAEKYMQDNKGRINGLPLDLYVAAAIVGANKITHGVMDFAEWSESMMNDWGKGLRLSLHSLYSQSQQMLTWNDDDWDEYLAETGTEFLDQEIEDNKEGEKNAELDANDTEQLETDQSKDVPGNETEGNTGKGSKGQRGGNERSGTNDVPGTSETSSSSQEQESTDGSETQQYADETSGGTKSGNRTRKPRPIKSNLVITDELDSFGSAKERYKGNIAAIRLLHQLTQEERFASRDEQKVLARYVGWGGLVNAFGDVKGNPKSGWENEFEEVKQLVTDGIVSQMEYEEAKESTQYAHYTAKNVVDSMYAALSQMGFKGGRILEPAMGVGNFFGLLPKEIVKASTLTGVEKDSLSGKIAKQLYQNANIDIMPYQDFKIADGYFDVAIGNPPFSALSITYNKSKYRLHNFFFIKSLDKVREGGLLAFVTSSGSMNSQDKMAREEMAKRADFLGAIRLPGNAFKENAGTEVTTDILFFQKREEGKPVNHQADFIDTYTRTVLDRKGEPTEVRDNVYFNDHPEMVLGNVTVDKLVKGVRLGVVANGDVTEQLKEAIQHLPKNLYTDPTNQIEEIQYAEEINSNLKNELEEYNFGYQDGKIVQKVQGKIIERTDFEGAKIARIRAGIEIRDAAKKLLLLEHEGASDKDIKIQMIHLNHVYDAFVKKYKELNSRYNVSAFKEDPPSLSFLISLEKEENGKWVKQDIFKERVMSYVPEVKNVNTPEEALIVSLFQKGRLDLDYMSEVLKQPQEDILKALMDRVYNDPINGWVIADEYLSGNVREKLEEAQAHAKQDRQFERNVKALEAAVPEEIPAENIYVQFGSPFIPDSDVRDFALEFLGRNGQGNVKVKFVPSSGSWIVKGELKDVRNTREFAVSSDKVGGDYNSGLDLMELALNAKDPRMMYVVGQDANGKAIKEVDQEATALARQRTKELQDEFVDWLWKDRDRTNRLVRKYNMEYNSTVLREYDGSLIYGGQTEETNKPIPGGFNNIKYTLRTWQKNAVWRLVQGGNALLAHVVGSGKTLEMIVGGMEMKRMGLINKPAYVVPVSLVDQWQREFREAYPNKNILVLSNDLIPSVATTRTEVSDEIPLKGDISQHLEPGERFKVKSDAKKYYFIGTKGGKVLGVRFDEKKTQEPIQEFIKKGKYMVYASTQGHAKGVEVFEFKRNQVEKKYRAMTDPEWDEKQNDHRVKRAASLNRIAVGNYDAIIISHETFKRLRMSAEAYQQFIREQIEELEAALIALAEEKGNEMTIKQLETAKEALEEKLKGSLDEENKDIAIPFEMLGIDQIFVDEAHKFKNLEFQTKMQRISGLNNSTAERSMDMFVKTRWLTRTRNGKGVVFATGTPISNTMAELYTMMRYLQFDRLKELAITHFDSWAKMFGETEASIEMDVAGGFKERTRFKRFKQLRVLMKLWNEVTDIKTAKHLDLPRPKNVELKQIITKMTDEQQTYMAEIVNRANALEGGGVDKREDNWLKLTGDARKMSVDIRLVDPYSRDNPGSKVNSAVKEIFRIWKDGTPTRLDKKGKPIDNLAQLAFLDLGTPKDKKVNEDGEDIDNDEETEKLAFDVYSDIRTKLIQRGVPADQIAFIHDAKTEKKKTKLFKDVREGKVRILLGSTEKMGAGMNVQDRLVALHHIDAPWRPSDVEQQEGRMIRQGNRLDDVEVYTYITEGSFDRIMWDMLKNKASFIEQLMNNDGTVDEMEDVGALEFRFAHVSAAATGDSTVLDKMNMDQKVKDLQNAKEGHRKQIRQKNQRIVRLEERIPEIENDLKEVTVLAERVQDVSGDKFKLVIDGKTYTKRVDAAVALETFYKENRRKSKDGWIKLGEISGFEVTMFTFGDYTKLQLESKPWQQWNYYNENSASGSVSRIENLLDLLTKQVSSKKNQLEDSKRELKALKEMEDKPFKQEAELQEALQKQRELNQRMLNMRRGGGTEDAAKKEINAAQDEMAATMDEPPGIQDARENQGQTKTGDHVNATTPKGHVNVAPELEYGDRLALAPEIEKQKKKTPVSNVQDELEKRVHAQNKNDQMDIVAPIILAPVLRRRPGSRKYAFENPNIQDRVDAAEEIPKQSLGKTMKDFLDRQARRMTREYEHLPHTGEFSPLRHELLRLEKQRSVAIEQTARNLQGLLIELNRDQYELFRNLVLTADLVEEAKAAHALPFGFTEETLKHERNRLVTFLKDEPAVKEAISLRLRLWDEIKKNYTQAFDQIGVDVSRKFTKRNYYRHLIIEKAQEKKANHITGKKELKTPKGQGYMKQRHGSEKDFVTDYLLAESEVMANMLFDMEVAKTIHLVDQKYNEESNIKKMVEAANSKSYQQLIAQEAQEHERRAELEDDGLDEDEINQVIEREHLGLSDRVKQILEQYIVQHKLRLGKNHETQIEAVAAALKGRVGWAYAELKKLAEDEELWTGANDEYADLVEDFANGVDTVNKNTWFEYLSDLLGSGETGSDWAGMYLKFVRLQKSYRKDLIGENFKTVENSIPEGYDVWQPDKGNVFYMANTLPEYLIDRLFNGTMDDLTEGDFTKIMALGGKKKGFIVKEEVKTTLENLMEPSKFDPLKSVLRSVKSVLLIGPTKLFKYNARNMVGDLDKVITGNPDTFKYFFKAADEITKVFFKHDAPSKELKAWLQHGGVQTLIQSQEFGDLKHLAVFRDKMIEKEANALVKTSKIPKHIWDSYWAAARKLTDSREAVLRYASFLSYLDQLEKNNGKPKNYGASLRQEIDALDDNVTKAFNLSNDLLIAYDKTSATGKGFRDTFFPFFSYIEGNARSYVRVFRNAYYDEDLTGAVGRKLLAGAVVKSPMMVIRTGKLALKLGFLTVLLALWNHLLFPDEEDELSDDVKNTVHIVYGRDSKGNVLYFNRLGTLEDFLGWFGMDDVDVDIQDILNNKRTFLEVLGMDALKPVNKTIQAVNPIAKQLVEQVAGLKFYPDFTKPSRIGDRKEYALGLIGADKEYAALRDTLIGRPHKGYKVGNLFTDSIDPAETNYYTVRDHTRQAAEKLLGKKTGTMVNNSNPKSEALYELKLGLHYNDMEYAEKMLQQYVEAGGNARGLKQSLKSLDPLYSIPTDLRQEYYDTLDAKEKDRIKRAYQFYEEVLLNNVNPDDF